MYRCRLIDLVAFYSETCLHIHRLFPKGGHQHWFFSGVTFGL